MQRLYRDQLVALPHGSRRVGLMIEPAYQRDFLSRLVWIFAGMLDAELETDRTQAKGDIREILTKSRI